MQSEQIVVILVAIFGSVGFWNFITALWQNKQNKKSNQYDTVNWLRKGILALLHNELYDLCDKIIEQGYKTPEQVERLAYQTPPYFGLDGDGTLKKLLEIIDDIPIKKE